MFYVRIAIAVAVWVSIWNMSMKEKSEFFHKWWEWFKGVLRKCRHILKRWLLADLIWLVIYLGYRWLKMVDWDWVKDIEESVMISIWNGIKFLVMYFGVWFILCLPLIWLRWLAKKEAEWKQKRANKKLRETQINNNLERLDLWEHEINDDSIEKK